MNREDREKAHREHEARVDAWVRRTMGLALRLTACEQNREIPEQAEAEHAYLHIMAEWDRESHGSSERVYALADQIYRERHESQSDAWADAIEEAKADTARLEGLGALGYGFGGLGLGLVIGGRVSAGVLCVLMSLVVMVWVVVGPWRRGSETIAEAEKAGETAMQNWEDRLRSALAAGKAQAMVDRLH